MSPRLLAYLQLFRLPNVFTAMADVLMGFSFVQAGLRPVAQLITLLSASCLLYTAGIVLNDVFDFEVDKVERPSRPLPSGQIDRVWAAKLGFGMLGLGVVLAIFVSAKSGAVAAILALAIYVYDGITKQTGIAPVVMGSCRMLNVLLGMSFAAGFLAPDQLVVAGGLGIYVAGITCFARCEAKTSDRKKLVLGLSMMAAGIAVVGCLPWVSPQPLLLKSPGLVPEVLVWPVVLALVMFSVGRRCVIAISNPDPSNVQRAVKHSIFSLVVLDAAIVLAVVGPTYAIGVVALLIPTVLLGKWVYST